MKENSSFRNGIQDESLDIREQFDKYLKYWPYFIFSIFICLLSGYLYLRYTVPQYQAAATIFVKDEKKGSLESELSAFSDLGLTRGIKSNVDNEIEIIKSRTIIEKAIKKLDLNVEYFNEGRVKSVEMYTDKPVIFSFFETNKNFYEKSV